VPPEGDRALQDRRLPLRMIARLIERLAPMIGCAI
jgi:hypothetical protein